MTTLLRDTGYDDQKIRALAQKEGVHPLIKHREFSSLPSPGMLGWIYIKNELGINDEEAVYTSEIQQTMLPYQQVKLLARHSPIDKWHASGDFEDRPVEDGDAVQVWTLGKEA